MRTICDASDLNNESDVEAFFLLPLIKLLGYKNSQIKNKKSLKELGVKKTPRGKGQTYRPDMLIEASASAKFIVEAKSPSEKLDAWTWQPKSYAIILNSSFPKINPVQFYVLSNGLETRVYRWDYDQPIFRRLHSEIQIASPSLDELRDILSPKSIKSIRGGTPNSMCMLNLKKPSIAEVNDAFSKCHQLIYKNDNISQSAAFFEFVKIIALKLISDKQIRDANESIVNKQEFSVDAANVKFSTAWVEAQENNSVNPLSDIWFDSFIKSMEKDIGAGVRRRIFEPEGAIKLSAETIKEVVKILESKYLFGIDADLNGRLFETFLSATMRGKDLGQYFTPRSIVKLGVKLARIKVDVDDPIKSDRVYDGCCGTGGFLIDVLANMWAQVDSAVGKTEMEKQNAKDIIKSELIWGCEIGKDPNLARIARLNMYLHGDGGATIFNLDGLDKELKNRPQDTSDQELEKKDFLENVNVNEGFFNVIITNPPFAKSYKLSSEGEERHVDEILHKYQLLAYETEKRELRSNLMFIERYYDLMKPGGRLITILDDGILSGNKYSWFRRWLLEKFIIKAVVSLPGDAFQRSKARVKTSFVILQKKTDPLEVQCDVFMYACRYVGLDDPSRARSMPIDIENAEKAKLEIDDVFKKYNDFCSGKKPRSCVVPSKRINDRLDVKYCLIKRGASKSTWKSNKLKIVRLKDIANEKIFKDEQIIECQSHNEIEKYLRVTYKGESQQGELIDPSTTKHSKLYRVETGDIAISNIAATYGSIGYISDDENGFVVSSEYTILKPKNGFPERVLWAMLRSSTFRSEMLLAATGANRTRVRWELIKDIELPIPDKKTIRKLNKSILDSELQLKKVKTEKENAIQVAMDELKLESKLSEMVLDAFKPPK